jgi:hypothetical protein
MDEERKVKAEDIEGLREMISSVIREERAVFLPAPFVQDVDELRRSPAGTIIRLEGKVDHLTERFTDLEETLDQIAARMVTRDELSARIRTLATKEDLAGMATKDDLARMATRDELQAGLARMATREDLAHMATKEDLQAGLARMASKEDLQAGLARMASKEDLQAGLARMATREDLARMATREDLDIRLDGLEKQLSILRIAFFAITTLIAGLQTAILIKMLFP